MLSNSLQCSSQRNCKEKVFPKSCARYPLCNALPNGTAKRRSSQRAVPGILFAMLFPTELQREGLPKELCRVSSLQCSSQQNCKEKVSPKSCAGYPVGNALPNRTAKRRSSQRAVPGILFAMLFPTELQREGLPKELCQVSSLQCSSQQNCKEKVFPKSCAGYPVCNALPNRTAKRRSSQRAVPGILFAMLFPTELQREGLPKELCRVSRLQCSSQQNCKEKVFPKSCAGYPLRNAHPNKTAKRRSSQRAVPGILFAMLFPTELQREGLPKELCRVSRLQCSSQQNCKEKVFPKSCAGYPLCNALPNKTAKRRSSQRAVPGILFAMLFPTELQWECLPKELRRVSSLQRSSRQNCKEKVFPKSCAGYHTFIEMDHKKNRKPLTLGEKCLSFCFICKRVQWWFVLIVAFWCQNRVTAMAGLWAAVEENQPLEADTFPSWKWSSQHLKAPISSHPQAFLHPRWHPISLGYHIVSHIGNPCSSICYRLWQAVERS